MPKAAKPDRQISELDLEVRPGWAWTMRVSGAVGAVALPFALLWEVTAFKPVSLSVLAASALVFLVALAKARPKSSGVLNNDGPWTIN
jgi:hypothetical protein